jgi:dsDNA-specific endonuclease/ATPase MutS2
MSFQVHDRVEVLDDSIRGIVKKVESGIVYIETSEGFLLDFSPSELVRIEDENGELFLKNDVRAEVLREKQAEKKPRTSRVKPKERNVPPMEIDLHIEKLVNSYRGMSNYDILTLQLDTAKRQIEFAARKRIQKIVFIHGVGEGVLKAELDYLLGRYDNLKFYDADYQKYGAGATEVYFFQNVS